MRVKMSQTLSKIVWEGDVNIVYGDIVKETQKWGTKYKI